MNIRGMMDRWFNEGWGNKNEAMIDELFSPDFQVVGLGDGPQDREAFRGFYRSFGSAWQHVELRVDELMEHGSDFAARCSGTLTDRKNGRHMVRGAVFGTVKDGLFTRTQDQWDFVPLLESTGTISAGSMARLVQRQQGGLSHRAFFERWFKRLWGDRDASVIDDMVDERCAIAGLPDTQGRAAFHAFFNTFSAAFPSVLIEVLDCVEEGEAFSVQCSLTVIDQAGKTHRSSGCATGRIRDGKMTKADNFWDFLTLLESMGAVEKDTFSRTLSRESKRAQLV